MLAAKHTTGMNNWHPWAIIMGASSKEAWPKPAAVPAAALLHESVIACKVHLMAFIRVYDLTYNAAQV